MITLRLSDNTIIEYDPNSMDVIVNGKVNKDWEPCYVELPDDVKSLQLYGFIDNKNKLSYNLKGEKEPLVDQNSDS